MNLLKLRTLIYKRNNPLFLLFGFAVEFQVFGKIRNKLINGDKKNIFNVVVPQFITLPSKVLSMDSSGRVQMVFARHAPSLAVLNMRTGYEKKMTSLNYFIAHKSKYGYFLCQASLNPSEIGKYCQ